MSTDDTLLKIAETLESRKQASPEDSYVARLYAGGLDAMLAKIREEAGETVEAGSGEPDHLVHEVADLWFHCLVLLAWREIGPQAVLDELERRFGTSGLVEKAQRERSR
ncbi:MAG: phosphoribosyl-ATP diphosphatase [Gammaproteobacteria bacterium]|nr:phosphoribosyl-ATP diphosphatase [Gammaproteobacteria bacterium]